MIIDIDAIDNSGFLEIDSLKFILKTIVDEIDTLKAIKNVVKMEKFGNGDLKSEVIGTDVYFSFELEEEPTSFIFGICSFKSDVKEELIAPDSFIIDGKNVKWKIFNPLVERLIIVYKNK